MSFRANPFLPNSTALNFTVALQNLAEINYTYLTPRFVVPSLTCRHLSSVTFYSQCDNNATYMYLFGINCSGGTSSTTLYSINFTRESDMGLGRYWPVDNYTYGDILLSSSVASDLGVSIGDVVWVKWPLNALGSLGTELLQLAEEALPQGVYFNATVVAVLDDAYGKLSSDDSGDFAFIGYNDLIPRLASNPDIFHAPTLSDLLAEVNLEEWADFLLANLPPERTEVYIDPNYDDIQNAVLAVAGNVSYQLGFNLVIADVPVLSYLYDAYFKSLFLSMVINIIILILLVLSAILMYSLLIQRINVETRTFEMGVFRMIGLTRAGVIGLLLSQAFSYAIPGWALGLVGGHFLVQLVSWIFEGITKTPLDGKLDATAIGTATAMGLALPLISSLLPIRRALKDNLATAMDTRRSKTVAVQIDIERSENKKGMRLIAIAVGVGMAGFGFGIYFVFPLALLSSDFALLLNLFFVLLMAMLLGLVMLSLNLETLLERAVTLAFFFWDKPALRVIVGKNLIAHRVRNRKTTIMYALSLAFVILISVLYDLQISQLTYQELKDHGAELVVLSTDDSIPASVRDNLESWAESSSAVADWTWATTSLVESDEVGRVRMSNLGSIYSTNNFPVAVSPNFFDVTGDEFTIPSRLNASYISASGVLWYLYSWAGSSQIVLGSLYEKPVPEAGLGLTLNSSAIFRVDLTYPSQDAGERIQYSLADKPNYTLPSSLHIRNNILTMRLQPSLFLDSCPLYDFGQFPDNDEQNSLVSFTTFLRMLPNTKSLSIDDIPLGAFLVKYVDDVTDDDRKTARALVDALTAQLDVDVWEFTIDATDYASTAKILDVFFIFTTVVAMTVSYFSLSASMVTNIREQGKELGILRALGLNKRQMRRVYIYEAFVLVFSSSLLGCIIGLFTGYTVLLQRVLFTQLPVPFSIPWELILIIFGLSVVAALLSTFGPVRQLLKTSITQAMRTIT